MPDRDFESDFKASCGTPYTCDGETVQCALPVGHEGTHEGSLEPELEVRNDYPDGYDRMIADEKRRDLAIELGDLPVPSREPAFKVCGEYLPGHHVQCEQPGGHEGHHSSGPLWWGRCKACDGSGIQSAGNGVEDCAACKGRGKVHESGFKDACCSAAPMFHAVDCPEHGFGRRQSPFKAPGRRFYLDKGTGYCIDVTASVEEDRAIRYEYHRVLTRIADMPYEPRPDGTYNYDRNALIQMARTALERDDA